MLKTNLNLTVLIDEKRVFFISKCYEGLTFQLIYENNTVGINKNSTIKPSYIVWTKVYTFLRTFSKHGVFEPMQV